MQNVTLVYKLEFRNDIVNLTHLTYLKFMKNSCLTR